MFYKINEKDDTKVKELLEKEQIKFKVYDTSRDLYFYDLTEQILEESKELTQGITFDDNYSKEDLVEEIVEALMQEIV